MAIKPILFNTEMVKAILAGCKTQTRRAVRFVECDVYDAACAEGMWSERFDPENPPKALVEWFVKTKARRPFAPGDILWVRETWTREPLCKKGFIYRAVFNTENGDAEKSDLIFRWYPSIHMPKEAARIFLCVKSIRVERLQDITEKDADAEGMPDDLDYPVSPVYCPRCHGEGLIGSHSGYGFIEVDCPMCDTSVKRFGNLWNSTISNADFEKYGWDANPWVWVIEFERCEKPEGWCK